MEHLVTLILFTIRAPDPLAEELARQGHQVYEALAISEVLALAEQHSDAQIIITSEVGNDRAAVIQQHYPTLHLKAGATAADVIWEMDQLSPRSSVTH